MKYVLGLVAAAVVGGAVVHYGERPLAQATLDLVLTERNIKLSAYANTFDVSEFKSNYIRADTGSITFDVPATGIESPVVPEQCRLPAGEYEWTADGKIHLKNGATVNSGLKPVENVRPKETGR